MLKLKISSKLMDELSLLYSDKYKAIGEIIINSIDSGAKKVWVITHPDHINVIDDGEGMTEEEIINRYLLFGYSHKQLERLEKKSKRPTVGRKGIAKVSGLSIANRVTVTTWKNNKKCIFYIDREDYTKNEFLSDYKIPHETIPTDKNETSTSGTEVKLTKLRLIEEIDERELMDYIAVNLPVFYKDLEIRVNGNPVERTRIPYDEYLPINEKHPILGKIEGEIFKARYRLSPFQGVITRVRGIVIGQPHLFKTTAWQGIFGDFLGGEINRVEAFEKNDEGLITAGRESFIETNPLYQEFEKYMREKITGFINVLLKKKEVKRKENVQRYHTIKLKSLGKFISTHCSERFRTPGCSIKYGSLGKTTECVFDRDTNSFIINTDHPSYKYAVNNKWVSYHAIRAVIEECALQFCHNLKDYKLIREKMFKIFVNPFILYSEKRKKQEEKKRKRK